MVIMANPLPVLQLLLLIQRLTALPGSAQERRNPKSTSTFWVQAFETARDWSKPAKFHRVTEIRTPLSRIL